MLKSYFTIAWRNLLRRPLSTTIHILGLATGISACLVIFLVVRHELAHDQFHPNHERIFRVVMNAEMFDGTSFNLSGTPPALYPVLAREASGLEQVAPFYDQVTKVSLPNDQGQPRKSEITSRQAFTQAEFFQIFAYEWLKGSPTTALASPGQVVLTQKQAQLYFGQAEPLGKTILYGDSLLATVTGVVRDLAQPSYFAEYTDFISYSSIGLLSELKMIYNENDWDTATGGNLVFIKLTTGTTPARVEQQLASMRQRAIATGQKIKEKRDTYKLQPLADIHFNPEYDSLFRQAHRPTLYALALVATVLLLVACINFVNLATAQATQRAKEVGIRKTLGSTQGHLMAQFLGEAGLIALAAVGLAAALTGPWLHLFADYLPPRLTYRPFSGENLVFLIGIWLTVSLLAGTYPALVLARFAPALAMKNQVMASGRGGKATVRKGLILAQFAVAQAFIIFTLLVGSQIDFLLHKDLGFKKDEILTFYTPAYWRSVDSAKRHRKELLAQQLRQLAPVEQVSLSNGAISNQGMRTDQLKFARGKELLEHVVHLKSGDSAYFSLFGLQLLAGRPPATSDTLRQVVINQTYLKALGFQHPQEALGRVLNRQNGAALPIVGVVKDFHVGPLHQAIPPTIITLAAKYNNALNVKLQTKGKTAAEVQALVAQIEQLYNRTYADADDGFQYTWFDESLAQMYEQEQRMARLMRLATGLAIFIACLGLFGLAAFTVTQRAKEVGIRKVLGATVAQVTTLLCRDFMRPVGLAFGLAAPVAYYAMQHWLADFAYQTTTRWELFALAGGLAAGVALATVGYQALKAALANPVHSLRNE